MTFKRLLINATLVLGLLLAGYLLYTVFRRYSLDEIAASVAAIPLARLIAGTAFAAASYLCLTGFDWLALRYAGKPLSYPRAAIASFTALSIGHNLGIAALSSGAVRYRFYARWGLTTEEVAKVILFCGVTVGLGLVTLAGIALLANPSDAANVVKLDAGALFLLGLACLAVPAVYMLLAATLRAPLSIWKWSFRMPGTRMAAAQIIVGTANFVCVAACLHQMIAAEADVGFVKTATAYVLANIAILLTHVPGGLGVLEATVSHVLPGSASVGALVAFRVIYFIVPLFIGLALFCISEITVKRRSEDRREQPRLESAEPQARSV